MPEEGDAGNHPLAKDRVGWHFPAAPSFPDFATEPESLEAGVRDDLLVGFGFGSKRVTRGRLAEGADLDPSGPSCV